MFWPAWGLRIVGWLRLEGTLQIIPLQCLCLLSPSQGRWSIHRSAASLGIAPCQAWGGGSAAVPLLPTCAWSSDPNPCQRLNARLPRDGREQMEGWEEGASRGTPVLVHGGVGWKESNGEAVSCPAALVPVILKSFACPGLTCTGEGQGAFPMAASSEIEPGNCRLQHFVPRAVLLRMAQIWLGSLERKERK